MSTHFSENEAAYDSVIDDIARYVLENRTFSETAMKTAAWCLLDSIGCGLLALEFPECAKMLGPVVPGATLPGGSRVFGTAYELDPITAAFNMGTMIRWLDYNDTWLAAEWGHPSDNFGSILAVADYLDRQPSNRWRPDRRWTVRDLLIAAIQAYEIQGVLALQNSFNRVGLDHVLLVRVASTAVATAMLGGDHRQVCQAVSQAWIDGGALRTYRHAPNTGSRKSWAAGDATRRAVQLALWTLRGEMGYPSALTTPRWGFQDVLFGGRSIQLAQPLNSYVMENVLFKVSFPAEFHAQTAAEAAIRLHSQICHRLDEVQSIRIETHESAIRIINKTGPLHNPADRDHCIQYITAIALIYGELDSNHYEDESSKDPRIDRLRDKMVIMEEPQYSKDYMDPSKRSIANAVQIFFTDGTASDRIEIEYPLGHRFRRDESLPALRKKFIANASTRFDASQVQLILEPFEDQARLEAMRASEWMDRLIGHAAT